MSGRGGRCLIESLARRLKVLFDNAQDLNHVRVQIDTNEAALAKELALSEQRRDEARRKVVQSQRIIADIKFQTLQAEEYGER